MHIYIYVYIYNYTYTSRRLRAAVMSTTMLRIAMDMNVCNAFRDRSHYVTKQ